MVSGTTINFGWSFLNSSLGELTKPVIYNGLDDASLTKNPC